MRTERVGIRLTAEQMRLLRRAAESTGRSLTDFILSTAEAAAEETIRTHRVMRLSTRDAEVITAALLSPPEPGDWMKGAVRRYRELVARE